MKYYLLAALALGLSSCLKTEADSCNTTLLTPIVSATGPKTIAVNQPATFTLGYLPGNGCGTLATMPEQVVGNVRTVGINVSYNTCTCAAAAATLQTTYSFVPTAAGTYYLKFVANNGYLLDTLVVK